MRDEFYGDRKDLWKWTMVLNEACDSRRIIYVAMYRPDEQAKNEFAVRADVADFFRNECKSLRANRKCSRIEGLSTRIISFLGVYEPG